MAFGRAGKPRKTASMRDLGAANITEAVIDRFAATSDEIDGPLENGQRL